MADYQPTKEQLEVLAHRADRHARLLAGPGTGKSATVVALLLKLLATKPPPRVRLLTFTRAATSELAHKVSEHPEAQVDKPSTVHSFAISVLLANPGSADFPDPLRIADDWEMKHLIAPDLAAMVGVTPRMVTGKLIPEMAASWESLEERHKVDIDDATRSKFVGAWQQHRRVYGYTLLAELPHLLREALQAHADLKGLEYDMVVVDEYQDLNACDLAILRQLAQLGMSVFGVGDDDQSIYSFRQAAPEGIRRFLEDYPGADDYTLSVSHRCGADIIKWARHVIEGDPQRIAKPPLTPADGSALGEVAMLAFPSNVTESRGVAQLIRHLIEDEGIEPNEIAVLLRGDHNQSFSKPIKDELASLGIAFDDPSWVGEVLNNDNNRETLLCLRLLGNLGARGVEPGPVQPLTTPAPRQPHPRRVHPRRPSANTRWPTPRRLNLASHRQPRVVSLDRITRIMPELPLDDEQRHAFARHLNGMSVTQLVRREPSPHPSPRGCVMELCANTGWRPGPPGGRTAQHAEQRADRQRGT